MTISWKSLPSTILWADGTLFSFSFNQHSDICQIFQLFLNWIKISVNTCTPCDILMNWSVWVWFTPSPVLKNVASTPWPKYFSKICPTCLELWVWLYRFVWITRFTIIRCWTRRWNEWSDCRWYEKIKSPFSRLFGHVNHNCRAFRISQVKELREFIPIVGSTISMINSLGYTAGWQLLLAHPFSKLDARCTPEQLSDCVQLLRFLYTCPIISKLDFKDVINQCFECPKAVHLAAALLPFLPENDRDCVMQVKIYINP